MKGTAIISDLIVDKMMKESPLPTALFSKAIFTYLSGTPVCRYEDWTRELINGSPEFMHLTNNECFHAPQSEANGEPDALTSGYCLDFKLILGNSAQHALRECAVQKVVATDGVVFTCSSRSDEERRAVRLHAALRSYNEEELRALASKNPKGSCADEIDRDVAYLLRSLDKDKNLLLILPVLLYSEDCIRIPQAEMDQRVYCDYKTVLALRAEWHPSRDTFIGYFHEGQMMVSLAQTDKLAAFDAIPVSQSKTFVEIVYAYDRFEYPLMDRLLGM